jgi:hypothetical protein
LTIVALAGSDVAAIAVTPKSANPVRKAPIVPLIAVCVGELLIGTTGARVDGRVQPVFALVRRSTSASLQNHFAAGGRAMHTWPESLAAAAVDDDAFPQHQPAEDPRLRSMSLPELSVDGASPNCAVVFRSPDKRPLLSAKPVEFLHRRPLARRFTRVRQLGNGWNCGSRED